MKNANKIYIFFIILALLFWNPLCFYFFYSDSDAYNFKVLHFLFWFIPIVSLIAIFLILKGKLSSKAKSLIFFLSFLGIFFSFIVLLNSIIGVLNNRNPAKKGLIFEPNLLARYTTVEFDYEAKINSIGLRDREVAIDKGNKYRILCFGDSWTFGWGVNIENSWPRKLEKYLHDRGYENIEVINAGCPGQYTTTYKEFMSKAVTLLKPDLVLVGVLQLDDLSQLYQNNFKIGVPGKSKFFKEALVTFLKISCSNIVQKIHNVKTKIDIGSNWKADSNKKIEGFNHFQEIRFYTLEDTIQSLFKTGNLNPALLDYYIDFPDIFTIFNNPNHPKTKFCINEMNKDVNDMKLICEKNNAILLFLNLPTNIFTGHKVIRTPSDILDKYFEENNKIDSVYNSIAQANELPYIQLTEYFRSLENKTKYFFLFDGHPTASGYEAMADYIGKQLLEKQIIKKQIK